MTDQYIYNKLLKLEAKINEVNRKNNKRINRLVSENNNLKKDLYKLYRVKDNSYKDDKYYSIYSLNTCFDEDELGKKVAEIHNFDDFKKFMKDHKTTTCGNSKDSPCIITYTTYIGLQLGNIITIDDVENAYKEDHHDWIVVDFKENSIGLFPVSNLKSSIMKMNKTDTTNGGYQNSYMKQEIIPDLLDGYREIFKSSIDYFDLADEYELFGNQKYQINLENLSEEEIKGKQLPLFKHISLKELIDKGIFSREAFWLRGVASSDGFCFANFYGGADSISASGTCDVRPLIYLSTSTT